MVYLVDSCYYIDRLRQGIDVRHEMLGLALSGRVLTCGIIISEVLRGCRNKILRGEMSAFFYNLSYSELNAEAWHQVANLAWEMDRMGKILPLTDIAIAVIARRENAIIVSEDKHFIWIPKIRVQKTLSA